jgi:S1-C subfamily serine protease
MAPRFLGKTNLSGIEALRSPAGIVLDAYAELSKSLQARVGPYGAELFAEPVITWAAEGAESSISWYTDVPGEPAPLSAVSAERRAMLENSLRGFLARLAPLLNDPGIGPNLQQALRILSLESLFAIGDRIVLTDWGLTQAGNATAGPGLVALRNSPVGAYLPAEIPQQAVPAPPTPVPDPAPQAAARPIQGMASPFTRSGAVADWWLVPAALSVAALFLALGYWRGSVLAAERAAARPSTVSVVDDGAIQDAIKQQEAMNEAIQKQIEERRRLLAGNVCTPDPASMPRLGPDLGAAPPPDVVRPPPGGQPFRGTLADLLKQAIVLIVAPSADGNDASMGSGFYIARDLIVTNRHVVEGAANRQVGVTNEKLGRMIRAEVVATSDTSDIGSLDVALLRVEPNPAVQALSFTTTATELDPVIAGGYPALVIRGDAAAKRLLVDGDLTAAPQLVLTDGRINAIQTTSSGIKVMPHSANISGGNSGGPLVDACGRVVGINTYVASDAEQSAHVNFAEKSEAIIAFLKSHGVAVSELAGPCAPGAAPGALPPSNPAATNAPPAAPPAATPAALPAPPSAGDPAPSPAPVH